MSSSDIAVDQITIIKKIKMWLATKPYHSVFEEDLSEGLCAGFVTAWLYYKAKEKGPYFSSLLEKISGWKGTSIAPEVDKAFEELGNILFWFQAPERISNQFFQPDIPEKINLLITKGPFVKPAEFQFSFLFSEAELNLFFKKIISCLKEKMVFISCGNHIAGVYVDQKNNMYFYDPNQPKGEILISSHSDLVNNLMCSFKKKSKKFIPISMNVFDFYGNAPLIYPTVANCFPCAGGAEEVNRRDHEYHISALLLATSYRQHEVMDELLKRGADPSEGLWMSAALGDTAAVKKLLAAGAAVHHVNHFGHDALFYAHYFKQKETQQLLEMHENTMRKSIFCLFHKRRSAMDEGLIDHFTLPRQQP